MLSVKNPHYINDSFDQPRAFIFFTKNKIMNLLEFIFQSFWHFTGSLIIIALLVQWRPFASSSQGLSAKQFDKILDQIREKQGKK